MEKESEKQREKLDREETRKKYMKMIRKKELVEKDGEFRQGKETALIRK